jgi:hypothetical protein
MSRRRVVGAGRGPIPRGVDQDGDGSHDLNPSEEDVNSSPRRDRVRRDERGGRQPYGEGGAADPGRAAGPYEVPYLRHVGGAGQRGPDEAGDLGDRQHRAVTITIPRPRAGAPTPSLRSRPARGRGAKADQPQGDPGSRPQLQRYHARQTTSAEDCASAATVITAVWPWWQLMRRPRGRGTGATARACLAPPASDCDRPGSAASSRSRTRCECVRG